MSRANAGGRGGSGDDLQGDHANAGRIGREMP